MTLTVRIKTLTPLWTGGLDGTMDRIHETGILGSLRWWYEAIVRGLGGSACAPTEPRCELTGQRLRLYEKAREEGKDWWQALDKAGICDACKVFGATGWKRRFRLEVKSDTQLTWQPRDSVLNIRPPERARGWYLLPGHVGTLTLKLEGEEKVVSMLACLFLWLEKYGSLGARPQLGYGAFRILNRDEVVEKAGGWKWGLLQKEAQNASPNSKGKTPDHPDLRRLLFFRYEFTPSKPGWWTQVPGVSRVGSRVQPLVTHWHTVPTTPALKNEWRFNQWQGNRREEVEIFGTLHPDRRRGRIGATWAYRENGVWFIHGWAWMPQKERLAGQLWKILADESVWAHVLGVQGNLTTVPSGQWKELTSEDVRKLLQGVCHD
ncbi:MAG TPA: type III-B CRISPR module RAMP protein Cmr1 [Thermodesulfatator atlanticus]|uniref:Type III-B CRISPR module RAMP protein Cmr1 n=1 Tax=Thermodesulfatator atlanticus TaxID=501497 RepID=A0A7V5U323_9BACT|nr:type III-B CRISPR module RAMP protein Cmr1 [Thermodesulfatator atlanticus]